LAREAKLLIGPPGFVIRILDGLISEWQRLLLFKI